MKNATCLLFLLCFAFNLSAQSSGEERRVGEMLIQLQPGASLNAALAEINQKTPVAFSLKHVVAKSWGIYLLQFEENQENSEQMLSTIRKMRTVSTAQWNHKITDRSLEPNDTEWWRQGDMSFINAPDVWETATGGLTPNGDTIVVAVLEKGALLTHPDLAPNRWWNWHEIPNNGLDDDGNGFIDDFGGWNPQTQMDDLGSKAPHGTGVHGIIGAKGNNASGISGVNWTVKLMNLSGIDYESDIMEGYEYVANTRKLYNQTNGGKGAFVVATNASFGFDRAKAEDFPMWCALYDSLGRLGVLSVAATVNKPWDVELEGDMPTTCTSEYLITVTNLKKSGVKESGAGYGSKSIDLGAPGTDTYTTISTGALNETPAYGTLGGTSAATPHVTGSVALLYSLGCDGFTDDAITDPISCVRRVRDMILNNTEPNESLEGITTTGGHLNLAKALAGVRDFCKGAKVGPLELLDLEVLYGGTIIRVYYQTPNFQPYVFRVFNMLGQQLYEESWTPQQFSGTYKDFEYQTTYLPRGVYIYSIGRGNAIRAIKIPKI